MESGMTTPPKMRRVAENDYEIGGSTILLQRTVFGVFDELLTAIVMLLLFHVVTETQRIGNSHLRKVSVSESNVLLDEEVLTDPKIQALLVTVLVRRSSTGLLTAEYCNRTVSQPTVTVTPQATQVKYTTDDFDQRILYEYLAEASVVFPKVFPVV